MLRIAILILTAAACFAQAPDRSAWKAPAEAEARPNPLKDRSELAAGGEKIFLRSCSTCHQPGQPRGGGDLSRDAVQSQSDGALFWKITTGNSRCGMPGFSSLPDGRRWQIVLYLRTLGQERSRP